MDSEEHDYLEKAVEGKSTKDKTEKASSKDHVHAEGRRRSYMHDDHNGECRERSERREKYHRRGEREDGERDREREGSRRHERHAEEERERRNPSRLRRHYMEKEEEEDEWESEKERDRRSRSSSRRREHGAEAEMERARSRDREREGSRRHERHAEEERERRNYSRSRRHYTEKEEEEEWELERERDRRSRSSSRRREHGAEAEMERARSRDRALREREAEREMKEKELWRLKVKTDPAEPEADPERDQRTVFAYQMPLKATERDVYEFFSQVGKVRDVRIIMDRNSRRSKGVGYIEYYDVASVQAAIQLSGKPFLGQPVMVKHSEAERNLVPSSTAGAGLPGSERKLYVGNLHFNMTEEHLRQIFEAFGPVEVVQMPLDTETGHCKGFGFVQFARLEHAKVAQKTLNGILEIAGRVIKVSSVTEHVGIQDTSTNATDFDDDDGSGLALNARSRALLMQKLDRTGTASSIAESLGVPVLNGTHPTPVVSTAKVAVAASLPNYVTSSIVEPIGNPAECILLKNLFDPSTETDPDFDLGIMEDVQEECSKFGLLQHIYVDKGCLSNPQRLKNIGEEINRFKASMACCNWLFLKNGYCS